MNYDKIYDDLIMRARIRELNCPLTGYTEDHHILPECLFPEFENLRKYPENKAVLSPEEHYLAHQLLVKMNRYKDHKNYNGLVYAAFKITINNPYQNRSKNKLYGWIKRLLSDIRKTGIHAKTRRKNDPNYKKIKCVETGEIFETLGVAAKRVGGDSNKISKCLKRKREQASGVTWIYVDKSTENYLIDSALEIYKEKRTEMKINHKKKMIDSQKGIPYEKRYTPEKAKEILDKLSGPWEGKYEEKATKQRKQKIGIKSKANNKGRKLLKTSIDKRTKSRFENNNGEYTSLKGKQKLSKMRKNKSYDEIFGVEKAAIIKHNLKISHTGLERSPESIAKQIRTMKDKRV